MQLIDEDVREALTSPNSLKQNWFLRSFFIEESWYLKLTVKHIEKEDPLILIRIIDTLTNYNFLQVFSKPMGQLQIC